MAFMTADDQLSCLLADCKSMLKVLEEGKLTDDEMIEVNRIARIATIKFVLDRASQYAAPAN